jgi:hypothetical protein
MYSGKIAVPPGGGGIRINFVILGYIDYILGGLTKSENPQGSNKN